MSVSGRNFGDGYTATFVYFNGTVIRVPFVCGVVFTAVILQHCGLPVVMCTVIETLPMYSFLFLA